MDAREDKTLNVRRYPVKNISKAKGIFGDLQPSNLTE